MLYTKIWGTIHGSTELPKTLEYLSLTSIFFVDMTFLSKLTALKSLELYSTNISHGGLAYIAENCRTLQSFKNDCE